MSTTPMPTPGAPTPGTTGGTPDPHAAPDPQTSGQQNVSGQSAASEQEAQRARGPRLGTVIWGVLVILAAAYLLFPLVLGSAIDLQLAAIVALAATGAALLLAAIVGAIRRR
ncbi:hypothetical protein [Salana multivorans]